MATSLIGRFVAWWERMQLARSEMRRWERGDWGAPSIGEHVIAEFRIPSSDEIDSACWSDPAAAPARLRESARLRLVERDRRRLAELERQLDTFRGELADVRIQLVSLRRMIDARTEHLA